MGLPASIFVVPGPLREHKCFCPLAHCPGNQGKNKNKKIINFSLGKLAVSSTLPLPISLSLAPPPEAVDHPTFALFLFVFQPPAFRFRAT